MINKNEYEELKNKDLVIEEQIKKIKQLHENLILLKNETKDLITMNNKFLNKLKKNKSNENRENLNKYN